MLVTVREIFDHTRKESYDITAPNIQSEDTVKAVLEVVKGYYIPMIVDTNAFIHTDPPWFIHMIRGLAKRVSVPVVISLDHRKPYEDIILGINSGFTSIMVDRSNLSYGKNVEQTKEAVEMCKPLEISVETGLGHIGMGDNYVVDDVNNLTVPDETAGFIKETGVNCLAVAMGTAHGRYTGTPYIDLERLEQLVEACGGTPLILRGESGTEDENPRKAVQSGTQKANLAAKLIVAGKEELGGFIEDPDFDKWKLIPVFKKGYKDRLAHYVELFNQAGKA